MMETGQLNKTSSVRDLVRQIITPERQLPEDLKSRILALGPKAVPPLLEILEDKELDQFDAPGEGMAPYHAVMLLGELRAPEAVQPMLRALQYTDYNDLLHDQLLQSMPKLGAAVVEPCLQALENADDEEARSSLLAVLSNAGVHDERIFKELLIGLEDDPMMGAGDLADYGDPRAIEPLQRAFDRYDEASESGLFAGQALIEIEEAIKELGGFLSPEREYRLDRVLERRRVKNTGTFMREGSKVGRNEPCPCGSGKKYKKCHLGTE